MFLHIDMDAFFAAVEQRDHPDWRGKPVIVGAPPDRRGVVSTCSYEARRFGVRSAMPSRQAFQLCPQGIFVRGRMARYKEVSAQVFAIFGRYTPLVEPLSIDEAFLDVSGVRRLFGEPEAIARRIKADVLAETGLTCSVGVAPNKLLAKLASEERKPDGLFVVPADPQARLAWLAAKPVRALWGVGPKLADALLQRGIAAVRDLQTASPEALRALVGPTLAAHLMDVAFGRDARPIALGREEKSLSREHTYPEDVDDPAQLRRDLRALAEDVGRRLRAHGLWGRTARLKLRYAGFRTVTRQAPFPAPVCDDFALRDAAWALLARHLEPGTPVRLIGFGVDNLTDDPSPLPPDDLFAHAAPPPRERLERLSRTLDALRAKGRTVAPPEA